jgi:hypothetical protein
MSKDLYPIITNYEYDNNKIILDAGKTFSKPLEVDPESDNFIDGQENKYTHTPYTVLYNYTPFPTKSFVVMTDYLKLTYQTMAYINKFTQCIAFGIDFSETTPLNINFANYVSNTIDRIKSIISEKYGNDVTFSLPYIDAESKTSLNINLISRQKREGDNKININVCPIHFYRPRSKGGDVIKICGDALDITKSNIEKEMPMFKNKMYLKKNKDDAKEYKDIHYVGKFILMFSVEFSTYEVGSLNSKTLTCKIHIVAKEMEIKYNVSHCESVLAKDLTNVEINNQLKTLKI